MISYHQKKLVLNGNEKEKMFNGDRLDNSNKAEKDDHHCFNYTFSIKVNSYLVVF